MKRFGMAMLAVAGLVLGAGCEHTMQIRKTKPRTVVKAPKKDRTTSKATEYIKIDKKYSCPAGKLIMVQGAPTCECPEGTQYDKRARNQKGERIHACKTWEFKECSSDSECHSQVPLCRKGFGRDTFLGYSSKSVCVSKENYEVWKQNRFYTKLNRAPKRFVVRWFKTGTFKFKGLRGKRLRCTKAVQTCGYPQCWSEQPVNKAKNQAVLNSLLSYASQAGKYGSGKCFLTGFGVVDRQRVIAPCFKKKHNMPTLRQIHKRLGKKRLDSAMSWIREELQKRNIPMNVIPTETKEQGKVAQKSRTNGADRKVIFKLSCSGGMVTPGKTGIPADPKPREETKIPRIIAKKETVVEKEGGGLKFYPLSFEVYGLGFIPTGSFVTNFSLTGGLKINLQFVEWFSISGFAGGGYSWQYAPNGRPVDVSWGFGVAFRPLEWLEIPVGFMSHGAGSTGDSVDFWEVHHTFYTGVDFVISPSPESYIAFVLGLRINFLDIYQRFFERPEARFGGFSPYLALRFRFPRKQKR